MTWDDPNNHARRQEVRRGGSYEEELPHKKKAKKKKRCRPAQHVWEDRRVYDWWISNGKRWVWETCSTCGKHRDRYEDA